MQYSKNAFTMIELIFVIVILGILSAVAIPKLSATRDDAVVSSVAQNIMVGAFEIASYAVSNAKTEDDLSLMSNALSNLSTSGIATLTSKKAVIAMGNTADCITIKITVTVTDDILEILFGNAGTDTKCISLQSAIDASKYPIKLRGQNVVY